MEEFSIFLYGITKKIPDGISNISDVFEKIKGTYFKDLCQKIQNIQNPDEKERKKERNQVKKNLTYITPAGTFSERKKIGIIQQSGLAPIDIDNLEDLENIKDKLKVDPFIHLLYTSPSGHGLKAIIRIPKSIAEYPTRVISFYNYLAETYNIPIISLDKSTHDISRACYLAYDPDVHYNSDAETFIQIRKDVVFDKIKDTSRSAAEFKEIIKLLFSGRDKAYIYKYMDRYSKWKLASDQYKDYSYDKAVNYVESAGKLSTDEKKSIIPELSRVTQEANKIVTIQSDKCTEIWIYRDGIYVPDGRTHIEIFLGNILGDFYDQTIVQKVIDMIRKDTYMPAEQFFSEEDPRYVCVQNGVLDIFTKHLYKFSTDKKFFNKLPITFNPEATCPNTVRHYETILEKEDIPLMQELYGYLLYRNYNIQRAFLFSGDGGNGKGKSIDQMKCFLGQDNSVNISLQAFESDGFMKGNLHKKLANLGSDLGKTELKDTSTFRELTGEDLVTARRKFLDPISFKNYAKMIFAVNTLPYIDDDTDGFWRRWIYVDFKVAFLSKHDYEAREAAGTLKSFHRIADITISDKLNTPEELSGVLNWALEGFERLQANKDFSYDKSYSKTKEMMQCRESSALLFANHKLNFVENQEQFEYHDTVYKKYLRFCFQEKNNGRKIKIENDLQFRKILENHGYALEKKNIAGRWEFRWYFVKLEAD